MFHSEKFIEKLNNTSGCKQIGYNCGHWVHHYETDAVLKEIKDFIK